MGSITGDMITWYLFHIYEGGITYSPTLIQNIYFSSCFYNIYYYKYY